MKQYLYSIVVIAVTSALFRVLCPDSGNLSKYFSFLTSAALLCATVVPISGLIGGISDGAGHLTTGLEQAQEENYSAVWLEKLSESTKEECEVAIAAHICGEFDISEKNITVLCELSSRDGELRLDGIGITLYSGALLKNPRQIESYVKQNFGVPCTVTDGGIKAPE